jgi:type VI secretion system secreted protein VgrG
MAETQQDRRLRLDTPLGGDVLLITRFIGDEQLSKNYRYELELASTDGNIAFDDIVGKNVTITLDAEMNGSRVFNGFVSEFMQLEPVDQLARYRAVVVPWLWFLTRVSDCRIFQQKSIPEIIEEVFQSRSFSQYEMRLSGSYGPLENCVQYRETDFNFVARLMEQEGICYYFVHADGEHTLVLADSPSAHDDCPGAESVEYLPWNLASDLAGIRTWAREARVCSGAFAHTDFDFKAPTKNLLSDESNPKGHDHAEYEIYDFPGEYVERSVGDNYSAVRIQELQARHQEHRGEADVAGLQTGHLFELEGAYRDDDNQKYLVTRLHHEVHSNPFGSDVAGGARFYRCRLAAIPATVEFRPQRDTPKPLIPGPQTAIVTGPQDEEIHTDEYGRVKVHFHWHRHDDSDDKSSCWIRVSQYWAGKQWGSIHIPRVGQEVVVEFLDGDPDRPLVTGRVYNGDNMPPYDLPGNRTQSGVKSRSSPGGGTSDFNEIRFEDKKGEEQVYIHAEKNQDNVVENNETTQVGSNRTEEVGGDETITIHGNRTETVDNNEDITIGVDRTENVGSNEDITIGGSRTTRIGANEDNQTTGNRTEQVGGNETRTITGTRAQRVQGAETEWKEANSEEYVYGNKFGVFLGNTQTFTGGSAVSVFVGAKAETTVGVKVAAQYSAEITRTAGVKWDKSTTKNIYEAPQTDIKGTAKITANAPDIVLTGGKKVKIVVGGSSITVAGNGVVIKCPRILFKCNAKYTKKFEGSDMSDK